MRHEEQFEVYVISILKIPATCGSYPTLPQ